MLDEPVPVGESLPSSRLVSSRSAVVTMIWVGVAFQPTRRWTMRPMERRGFSSCLVPEAMLAFSIFLICRSDFGATTSRARTRSVVDCLDRFRRTRSVCAFAPERNFVGMSSS